MTIAGKDFYRMNDGYRLAACCEHCGQPISLGQNLGAELRAGELIRNGQSVHVSPREAQVLEALLRSAPSVVGKQRIYDAVWGAYSIDVDPKIIDVMVSKLRRKVSAVGLHIETVWGVGFALRPIAA